MQFLAITQPLSCNELVQAVSRSTASRILSITHLFQKRNMHATDLSLHKQADIPSSCSLLPAMYMSRSGVSVYDVRSPNTIAAEEIPCSWSSSQHCSSAGNKKPWDAMMRVDMSWSWAAGMTRAGATDHEALTANLGLWDQYDVVCVVLQAQQTSLSTQWCKLCSSWTARHCINTVSKQADSKKLLFKLLWGWYKTVPM